MRVKQAHPKFPFNLLNLAKKCGEGRPLRRINPLTRTCFLRPQIHSVVRGILADQVNLSHPFADESSNLRPNRLQRTTATFSPHLRDHAKTAWVIAALCDL